MPGQCGQCGTRLVKCGVCGSSDVCPKCDLWKHGKGRCDGTGGN